MDFGNTELTKGGSESRVIPARADVIASHRTYGATNSNYNARTYLCQTGNFGRPTCPSEINLISIAGAVDWGDLDQRGARRHQPVESLARWESSAIDPASFSPRICVDRHRDDVAHAHIYSRSEGALTAPRPS